MLSGVDSFGIPITGPNYDCLCVGPFVGTHSVGLELDSESSFFRKYGLLVAVADAEPDDGAVTPSQIFLEELSSRFYAWDHVGDDPNSVRRGVIAHLDDAHQALLSRMADEERTSAIATAAGFALFEPDIAIVFHIGDCRVLRESTGYLRALTADHVSDRIPALSLMDKAEQIKDREPELTHYMGLLGAGEPEIRMHRWCAGDTFVVGTKGWHNIYDGFGPAAMKTSLFAHPEPRDFVEHSSNESLTADRRHDCTVAMVRVS